MELGGGMTLPFVANASQQTIYNMSLCAVWTTVFERLGQKYVVTICGVVVILTAWKMCGEASSTPVAPI